MGKWLKTWTKSRPNYFLRGVDRRIKKSHARGHIKFEVSLGYKTLSFFFFNLKFKNLMKFFREKEKPVPALMGISYQLCALNIRSSFLVFASEKVTL